MYFIFAKLFLVWSWEKNGYSNWLFFITKILFYFDLTIRTVSNFNIIPSFLFVFMLKHNWNDADIFVADSLLNLFPSWWFTIYFWTPPKKVRCNTFFFLNKNFRKIIFLKKMLIFNDQNTVSNGIFWCKEEEKKKDT